MPELDLTLLQRYRAETFRLRAGMQLRDAAQAAAYVRERGFVYFWPITGVTLPSLWTAVAGERPVADAHDDPGHVTWGWKDQSLDKRWWYYAKVLRGKATMIALDVAPYFYALSENYGEPERDYLDQYHEGLLAHEARLIYEALLEDGPLDTVTLRRKIRMTNKSSHSPFERGLNHLQRDFKILPVGVAQTGAWRYSFVYECTHRWFPDLPERSGAIGRKAARTRLAELYFRSVGAASQGDVKKLFQWKPGDVDAAIAALAEQGTLLAGYHVGGERDACFVLAEMMA